MCPAGQRPCEELKDCVKEDLILHIGKQKDHEVKEVDQHYSEVNLLVEQRLRACRRSKPSPST